jgi:DNA-binding NarL/FixJ family response regulator
VHLARRSFADGWVVKPLDAMRLHRAITAILSGGTYEDESLRPVTVTIPAPA